jgi:methyl-accepting chemotaxis protein
MKQLYQHKQAIHSAEQVEKGVALTLLIKPVALELAKHRGIMAQYLGGAKDKADSLRVIETTVDQQLQQLQKLNAEY